MSGSFQTIPDLSGFVNTTTIQNVGGKKAFTDTTQSTSTTSGTTFAGGVGIAGNVNAGISTSNHALSGNLTVGVMAASNSHTVYGGVTFGPSSSTSSHNIYGFVALGSSSATHTISGTINLSSSTNTHNIGGSLNLSNGASTHTIAGGLSITKFLTTSGRRKARRTVTANITTVTTDEVIYANANGGSVTITLLSAATAGDGAVITVYRTDTNALTSVTVTPVVSGGTVGMQSGKTYMSDGTNWSNIG